MKKRKKLASVGNRTPGLQPVAHPYIDRAIKRLVGSSAKSSINLLEIN
jgi:hypothetical protein